MSCSYIKHCAYFIGRTDCFVGKRDVCAAITHSLGGLSTVAMLCGNVLGMSNVIVPSLSPCSCSCTISSNMYVKCLYSLLSKICLATHAFLPFGNSSLNLGFPMRK